jgi:hypothetical protein
MRKLALLFGEIPASLFIQRPRPNPETINLSVGDVMLKVKELVEKAQTF